MSLGGAFLGGGTAVLGRPCFGGGKLMAGLRGGGKLTGGGSKLSPDSGGGGRLLLGGGGKLLGGGFRGETRGGALGIVVEVMPSSPLLRLI